MARWQSWVCWVMRLQTLRRWLLLMELTSTLSSKWSHSASLEQALHSSWSSSALFSNSSLSLDPLLYSVCAQSLSWLPTNSCSVRLRSLALSLPACSSSVLAPSWSAFSPIQAATRWSPSVGFPRILLRHLIDQQGTLCSPLKAVKLETTEWTVWSDSQCNARTEVTRRRVVPELDPLNWRSLKQSWMVSVVCLVSL